MDTNQSTNRETSEKDRAIRKNPINTKGIWDLSGSVTVVFEIKPELRVSTCQVILKVWRLWCCILCRAT